MKIVKHHKNNNWLISIRKRLALSQDQMADHLKMNRTTYSMIELGKRLLPTSALLQVAQLEIKLAAEPQQEHIDLHPGERYCLSAYKRRYVSLFGRESACLRNKARLEDRLNKMKGLYRRTREWLDVIEKNISENRAGNKLPQYWKKLQQQAIRSLNRCSLPEQVFLQSRIALLNAEAELYRNMQEDLKKDLPGFFLEDQTPDTEEQRSIV